ncbi:MAG: hypothetical protein JWP32_48 [Schumannella sp.]|nr:hypothetical protein [Schumannella sp.]
MSETTLVIVRPRRSLLRTGFVSVVLAMIPLFGVLYWFSIEHGSWLVVFVVHVVVSLVAVAVLLRQTMVHSAVTETELVGNGIFSPMVRVPLTSVAKVDLVETYVGQAPESVTQLLVRDAEGKRLFRMRGSFYHDGDLQKIADALPAKPDVVREPIGLTEFFRTYPGSAYWFEHRPILRVVVFGLALGAALAVAAWVMTILGMPVGFQS